jgi:oligoribonuclease NrnB/cAMP/cGMP phosphodiesterase (DHH superfamily)
MKLCIYHGNCTDGFGAAWAVYSALGEHVEFYPGIYNKPPPDVSNKEVFLVDFSYDRPTILEMAKQAKSIVIIDHHKTAIERLIDLPENVYRFFDINHSGCVLTWNYFHEEPLPRVLSHIEDRDLWKFELPNTKEVISAIASYPMDFKIWDTLINEITIEELITEGISIERYKISMKNNILSRGIKTIKFLGEEVPIVNCPSYMGSELGEILAKGYPYSIYYYDIPEGRVVGLRSIKGIGMDVAKIAEQFKGGGHANASGFTITQKEAFELGLY